MIKHKVVEYKNHSLDGWGWWEQNESGHVKHEGDLTAIVKHFEQEGWEVCAYTAIPRDGGTTKTLILKRHSPAWIHGYRSLT